MSKDNGKGLAILHKKLEKNFQNALPKYDQFKSKVKPNKGYPADVYREMYELLTDQEKEQIQFGFENGQSVLDVSEDVRAPFHFVDWYKKRFLKGFRDLIVGRKQRSPLERMDKVGEALLTEIEDRLTSDPVRKQIEHGELVRMLKEVTLSSQRLREGAGDTSALKMTVVSKMPKKRKPPANKTKKRVNGKA